VAKTERHRRCRAVSSTKSFPDNNERKFRRIIKAKLLFDIFKGEKALLF